MSDFAGMEDLLQDFLVEAGDLLSGVDNKLVDLERSPDDRGLLNDIFRGFHTIKGGAGFLNATELVSLCHLTENLFDKLRNGELEITPEVMALADGAGSALGTGGMATKLRAARMVTGSGADMVIANGAHPELLYDIAAGRSAGTRFAARKED